MTTEKNRWEGITYAPSQNKYAATIPNGRYTIVVGYFDTLDEATDARHKAFNQPKQGNA